jgi:hypothetical protein
MAANITADTKAQILAAALAVHNRIEAVLGTNGYMDDVDDVADSLAEDTPSIDGKRSAFAGLSDHRADLARIFDQGRRWMDPILIQAGLEAGSPTVSGQTVNNLARLFRDISADLLGGTPDFVTKRAVTFAADPAAGAVGVIKRLTVDHLDEKLEGGYHNQAKTVTVASKDAAGRVTLRIQGVGQDIGDELDYRDGRPQATNLLVVSDVTGPTPGSVLNPWLTPADLEHDDPITDIINWTRTPTGSPTVAVDTTIRWRNRPRSLRFTGGNTTAVEYAQPLRPILTSNPWAPWTVGVPVYLESGWQGTIDITMGGKTQQFGHAALSAGNWVVLSFTLDEDNWPVNFDAAAPVLSIKLTNGATNTASIRVAGVLPQRMVQHEGIWYSAFAHITNPTIEQSITITDSCTFAGVIQDVISFLYHDAAPGWAHLPSSGTATMPPP